MSYQLSKNWWVVLLRGVLAALFGILVLVSPPLIVFETLVLFFGAYVLVDGVFAIVSCLTHRRQHQRWWVTLLEGIAGIMVGVITFAWPPLAALVLVLFFAAWSIVTGILELIAAVELRKEIKGEWLLALSGILSIVFGVLVYISPLIGMLTITWLIGAYALLFGITMIALSFSIRGVRAERAAA
jgi:uncharacterized membrane protein HdeD (DUF308 family)